MNKPWTLSSRCILTTDAKTELYSKGAYTNKRQKVLMCVVPTEKYSFLKSAIKEIDESAFIVVSDCYEVLGGTKKERIVF